MEILKSIIRLLVNIVVFPFVILWLLYALIANLILWVLGYDTYDRINCTQKTLSTLKEILLSIKIHCYNK